MFTGSLVALITPFRQGAIDHPALESLVEWHIQNGTRGIVPCGTTGEAFMLSHDEQRRIIETCVQTASKRVPIIPGTGAITTNETIFLTQQAKNAGADAVLIAAPAYVKPTQEGLYQHYKAIQDAVDIPMILYNNPGRSGVDIKPETAARLAKLPGVIGIKDTSGDVTRVIQIRLEAGPGFCQLSGDDDTSLAFLANGGHGCIYAMANIAPKACADLQNAWMQADLGTVARIRDQLFPIHQAIFVETSPGPVKYGLSLLGLCTAELRRPLVAISPATEEKVRDAMKSAGLLNG